MTYNRPAVSDPWGDWRQIIRPGLFLLNLFILVVALTTPPLGGVLSLTHGPTKDAQLLTKIERQTYSSTGSFHLTTVAIRGELTVANIVQGLVDDETTLIPRSVLYPEDVTEDEARKQHAAEMTDSQNSAALAALHELGMLPCGSALLTIESVRPDAPAAGVLLDGDHLLSVDGIAVKSFQSVLRQVDKHAIGEVVDVGVCRDGKERHVSVTTTESTTRKAKPAMGVTMTYTETPFPVKIASEEIGGPSAGLVFALSIVDLLTPEDLTAGKKIAGTGTITPTGSVGAIGGVAHKVEASERIGADIFLAPKENVEEARRALESDMEVVSISSLHDAVNFLRTLS